MYHYVWTIAAAWCGLTVMRWALLTQVRMSWCVMQDNLVAMKSDMEVIFERTGGRLSTGEKPEPFITMTQCQVGFSGFSGVFTGNWAMRLLLSPQKSQL